MYYTRHSLGLHIKKGDIDQNILFQNVLSVKKAFIWGTISCSRGHCIEVRTRNLTSIYLLQFQTPLKYTAPNNFPIIFHAESYLFSI